MQRISQWWRKEVTGSSQSVGRSYNDYKKKMRHLLKSGKYVEREYQDGEKNSSGEMGCFIVEIAFERGQKWSR